MVLANSMYVHYVVCSVFITSVCISHPPLKLEPPMMRACRPCSWETACQSRLGGSVPEWGQLYLLPLSWRSSGPPRQHTCIICLVCVCVCACVCVCVKSCYTRVCMSACCVLFATCTCVCYLHVLLVFVFCYCIVTVCCLRHAFDQPGCVWTFLSSIPANFYLFIRAAGVAPPEVQNALKWIAIQGGLNRECPS